MSTTTNDTCRHCPKCGADISRGPISNGVQVQCVEGHIGLGRLPDRLIYKDREPALFEAFIWEWERRKGRRSCFNRQTRTNRLWAERFLAARRREMVESCRQWAERYGGTS